MFMWHINRSIFKHTFGNSVLSATYLHNCNNICVARQHFYLTTAKRPRRLARCALLLLLNWRTIENFVWAASFFYFSFSFFFCCFHFLSGTAAKVIYDWEKCGETLSPLSQLLSLSACPATQLLSGDFATRTPAPSGAFETWLLIRVLFVPNVQ